MVRRRPGARRARSPAELRIGGFARFDLDRGRRTGVPEIILAEGKSPTALVRIVRGLHEHGHGALISRLAPSHRKELEKAVAAGLPVTWLAAGRLARLAGPLDLVVGGGTVAVVTAGTSDVPVATEAIELLKAVGVRVLAAHDVGVAGLHRLLRALRTLERRSPRIYLVFAGREGALPTVVAGLVRAPVIGIPTSQGYGRGGRGEAALGAMLQSCAPIAVVNIDASVPAALFALHLLAAVKGHRAPRRAPQR